MRAGVDGGEQTTAATVNDKLTTQLDIGRGQTHMRAGGKVRRLPRQASTYGGRLTSGTTACWKLRGGRGVVLAIPLALL